MARGKFSGTRALLLAARVVMPAAFIAVAGLAMAQDDRIDDPPDTLQAAQSKTQRGGGGSAQSAGGAGSAQTAAGAGLLAEPKVLTSTVDLAFDTFGGEVGRAQEGWYAEVSNMITGSGFVSLGPGYRHYMRNKQLFIDASAAASWHLYNMGQVRIEGPDFANHHLTAGIQGMWQDQTQVNYFGIGSDSLDSNQSQYRMQTFDAVSYGSVRPNDWFAIGGEFGWLSQPKILAPGGTFMPAVPQTLQEFPNDPGTQVSVQPDYLHGEVSLTSDTRDYRSHPTSGALYRAAWTTYLDQGAGTFTFREYEAEAAQFIPLGSRKWILALHGWALATDVPNGNQIPFYLMPALGGNNTIRSYSDYRFHDQNLAVVNVESRWAIFTHVDAAVFADAGNVAPRFADLNLNKTAIGVGLRLHTVRSTFARFDVAHGAEGWKFVFRTSDPLRLSRLTRRVAAIPFVD